MQRYHRKEYAASLFSIEQLSVDVARYTFKLQRPFAFFSGQYVWVEIMPKKGEGRVSMRRAFSICDVPGVDEMHVSIATKIRAGDYKQGLAALAVGDRAVIHGPFGSAFVPEFAQPKRLIMIAGGLGVTTFLSIAKTAAARPAPMFLRYLTDPSGAAPFVREIERAATASAFSYNAAPGPFCWDDVRDAYERMGPGVSWWVSGSQALVDEVFAVLIRNGVSVRDIAFEHRYPSNLRQLTHETITEHMRLEGMLTQTIQNSTNHTIITDANGIILFANRAAERITGYSAEEMLGNTPRLWGGMMSPRFYREFWQKKLTGEAFDGEVANRRKNGEIYFAIVHISPILGDDGDVIGFIGTEEDVTKIRHNERRIRRLNERFTMATRSAGVGIFEYDIATGMVFADETVATLYGAPGGPQRIAYHEWMSCIHPEDVPRVAAELSAAIDRTCVLNTSFRIPHTDGERFVRCIARLEEDEGVLTMYGAVWDVTLEKRVDQAKSEFVSFASHQLRAPLSAISWSVEGLLSGGQGELLEEQRSTMTELHAIVQRMGSLIDSLLDASRLELGTFILELVPTDIFDLMQSVLTEHESEILRKHITLAGEFDSSIPRLPVDPKLMRVLFQNLISNAVKYSHDDGVIAIDVSQASRGAWFGGRRLAEDSVTFSIADSGIGIPASEQGKIFSKLFRAKNARQMEFNGTGLGLYIIKSIVDQSGGQVWFQSREAAGTVFYLTYPKTGMRKRAS